MALTSAYPSLLPEDLPEDGWDTMQAWKTYFESFLRGDDTGFGRQAIPNISVDLSGHTFWCSREFLQGMIDLRVSQQDFIDVCINP